jgi:hypothetical protein
MEEDALVILETESLAPMIKQLPVINGKAHPYVPRILRKFGPRVIRYMRTIAVVCQHSILSINPYGVNAGINVVLFLIIGF